VIISVSNVSLQHCNGVVIGVNGVIVMVKCGVLFEVRTEFLNII
jgi:hypothetical protein